MINTINQHRHVIHCFPIITIHALALRVSTTPHQLQPIVYKSLLNQQRIINHILIFDSDLFYFLMTELIHICHVLLLLNRF